MIKQNIPLRFYGRTTAKSLVNDILISVRHTSNATIKDALVKRVLEATWFSIRHRLMITGRVKVPKLGDFEIERDRRGRIFVHFFPDPTLITEITASLVSRSRALQTNSDFSE